MDISRSTVIKSLLWKFTEKMGTQGISLLVMIVLSRLLEPKEYGIIAMISIFITLSNSIIDGGFGSALIQKKNATNVDFSTIFYVSLTSSVILYLILYLCSPLISSFYRQPELTNVTRVIGLTLLINSIGSVQNAYLSRNMMFRKSLKCNLISVFISGCIGITLAYMDFGVWALVAQTLSASCLSTLLLWFTIKWRPQFVFSKESLKELFDFGWKIFLTNIIITLFNNIRGLIIGRLYNPAVLAFFEKGRQLPHLVVNNLSTTIESILFPVFSNSQEDRGRVKDILKRSIRTSSLFVFPSLIIFACISRPLVIFLFTEKWLPCVPFLQIFCLAFMLMPLQATNMNVTKALGYSNLTLKFETLKKIIELIIMIISFKININAIAWGVLIYNMISVFINLYPNIKLLNYGYKDQFKDIFPMLILSIIAGGIIFPLSTLTINSLLLIFIQLTIGFSLYFLLCYIFKLEAFMYVIGIIRKKNK